MNHAFKRVNNRQPLCMCLFVWVCKWIFAYKPGSCIHSAVNRSFILCAGMYVCAGDNRNPHSHRVNTRDLRFHNNHTWYKNNQQKQPQQCQQKPYLWNNKEALNWNYWILSKQERWIRDVVQTTGGKSSEKTTNQPNINISTLIPTNRFLTKSVSQLRSHWIS